MKQYKILIIAVVALLSAISCTKEGPAKKKVTLTFDSCGGSEVPSQVLEAGTLATEPEDPTLKDYYFIGWTADETGTLWDFEMDTVDSDMTLYAIWDDEKAPKVTVMYYGAGGGNLDYKQIWKMRQAVSLGADDTFNMTFQYKFSEPQQSSEDYKDYHGVLRMDLVDAKKMKGCKVYNMTDDDLDDNLNGLPLKQYSDDDQFDMSSTDEIAKFIKWSVEKHPADKYVLIFADHGGGWEVWNDGGAQKKTKGIIYDDNLGNKSLTAISVTEGIKKSGVDIEVLYLDACLMGAWENMFEYRKAPVKYVATSMEVSYGGDYGKMIPQIKLQPDRLYDAFRAYIDQLVASKEKWDALFTDMGILDLSLVDDVTPIIRQTGQMLKEDCENPEVGVFSRVTAVVKMALMARWEDILVPTDMAKDIHSIYRCLCTKYKDGSKYYKMKSDFVILYKKNHSDRWESFPAAVQREAERLLLYSYPRGLAFGDLLKEYKELYDDAPEAYLSHKKQVTALYESYLSTLKKKSYFKASHCTDPDLPYVEVSPSINLMSMNEIGWVEPLDDGGDQNCNPLAKNYELNEIIRAYSTCELAQKTSWIEYLKVNTMNPSLFSNPTRATRYCKK